MIHFIAGAALSAIVIGAANSDKFKRLVGENRRKIKAKIDYARDYASAIDECAKEKIAKKPKAKKSAGDEK
jgi:hypothetical protein